METVLVFVVIPAAVIAVIGLATMLKKPQLRPEPYRLGDPWPYGPVWWSAVDEHGHSHGGHGDTSDAQPIGGSASATW
ncbi:aa3-type cytochrome oxidase subunit CtaJ [Lolliginicoccus levis]|uniref:aa3-type cytochrome oxidase subunit CtaJ n=1 Tax=Lolliginicoccus levis TaxID=2919542 RepID=UPI00241D1820|nr:hypothetical protein [Lolliginicoccus levis]